MATNCYLCPITWDNFPLCFSLALPFLSFLFSTPCLFVTTISSPLQTTQIMINLTSLNTCCRFQVAMVLLKPNLSSWLVFPVGSFFLLSVDECRYQGSTTRLVLAQILRSRCFSRCSRYYEGGCAFLSAQTFFSCHGVAFSVYGFVLLLLLYGTCRALPSRIGPSSPHQMESAPVWPPCRRLDPSFEHWGTFPKNVANRSITSCRILWPCLASYGYAPPEEPHPHWYASIGLVLRRNSDLISLFLWQLILFGVLWQFFVWINIYFSLQKTHLCG